MWILPLFQEMKFSLSKPPLLLCANLGAIHLSFNPIQHLRMKHIQIDLHFVRNFVQKNAIHVHHVHTNDLLAYLLTKPLLHQRTNHLRNKIDLTDGSPFLRWRIKGELFCQLRFNGNNKSQPDFVQSLIQGTISFFR